MPSLIDLASARKVEGHKCTLPIEDELLTVYLNSGIFVTLRRKIRRLCLVSPNHPSSRQLYKSTTQIRLEEAKQLAEYYNMIHPFSMGRFYMESIMIIVYFCLYLLLPLQAGLQRMPYLLAILRAILDFIALLDILMRFYTGYFNEELNRAVLYRKDVIKHYVKTFLLFDVIPLFPGYLLWNIYPVAAFYSRGLCIFRLVRIPTFFRYIKALFAYMDWSQHCFFLIQLSLSFTIAIFWVSTMNFIVLSYHYEEKQGSTQTQYSYLTFMPNFDTILRSLFVTTRMLCLIRTMEEYVNYTSGKITQSICMILGGVVTIMLFVEIGKIYTKNNSAAAHFEHTMIELEAFMTYKELPATTRARILEYINFKYHGNIITSRTIQDIVSPIIKKQILLNESKELLMQVDFLSDLPNYILLEIIGKLREVVYLTGEVITKVGQPSNCMFFIKIGTVAIYAQRGNELCHLEDGHCFGELALMVNNEQRTFTAVAVCSTNILQLTRKDFTEALQPFPEFLQHVRTAGLKKVIHLQKRYTS